MGAKSLWLDCLLGNLAVKLAFEQAVRGYSSQIGKIS
jgi:hypothetical protein